MRQTAEIQMPYPDGATLRHPETALLKWEGIERRLDIGQLCFLRRDTSQRNRKRHTVDIASLDESRVRAVRKLVTHLSQTQQLANFRPATMLARTRSLIQFVNWIDGQKTACSLSEKISMEGAYSLYARALRDQTSQNQLNKNTTANSLRDIRSTLEGFFDSEGFGREYETMRNSKRHVENTLVPDQTSQAALVSWCTALFHGISQRVLEFGSYPFTIVGVDYQTGAQKNVLMLPTPLDQHKKHKKTGYAAWDLETGRIHSYAFLRDQYAAASHKYPRQKATSMRRTALDRLHNANENPTADIRMTHAVLASYCFGVMFLAETGINLSQLLQMNWSKTLEQGLQNPAVVRQQFREIKYRAGGKWVSFQVGLGFLPALKTYLKLRAYLLRGTVVEPLFVTLSLNSTPARFSEQFIAFLERRLNALDIAVPRLSARKWRAAKQDWVISNHGPEVAAQVMGHSLDTALRSYSNGTDDAQRSEMGTFLLSVERTVLQAQERSSDDIQSAVGVCKQFKSPKSISAHPTIVPNCQSSEGCLFCDKYRIHADVTDIRKLISCRHCIRTTSMWAISLDEQDRVFGVVLKRVEFLLTELRKRDHLLVSQIEEDVDVNGNLDLFWSSKLEQMIDLGLA